MESKGKKPKSKKNDIKGLKNKKSLYDLAKKVKSKKNPSKIYVVQKVKTKKTSVFVLDQNPKKKSKKSVLNPIKKSAKKKEKNQKLEKSNIRNNSKNFSKLKLKESKCFNEKEKNNNLLIYYKNEEPNHNINNIDKFTNDFEINTMEYEKALLIDKRSFIECYVSILKTKHPILFTFCLMKDYNVFIIKLCIFLLSFSIYYAFNTIFFTKPIIHKIYKDGGNYNLSYLFPQIFYAFLISYHINLIIKYVSLAERNIIEIKREESIMKSNKKVSRVVRCLIIKHIIYFISSFLFLILFWYYLSSFCAVYQNSQVYLIKNTFISFALGLIYPFVINFFPTIIRKISLNSKNKCLYNTNKIFEFL